MGEENIQNNKLQLADVYISYLVMGEEIKNDKTRTTSLNPSLSTLVHKFTLITLLDKSSTNYV